MILSSGLGVSAVDISIINENIMWTVESESLTGGVFYTSNGGTNWQQQSAPPSNKIYMFNSRIGFISKATGIPAIYKTTNSGQNWNVQTSTESFTQMYFVDSLTGWRTKGDTMKYTINGGLNWTNQILPYGGLIQSNVMTRFSVINRDTIWGCGGWLHYPNGQFRGMIYRTTNSGQNWLFQVADTSMYIANYDFINFTGSKHGWCYANYIPPIGIHTTNGGDPMWLTGIQQISSSIPKDFWLYQNYPNPFNPRTVISYQLTVNSYVKLIVYDIQGKEVTELVNQKQSPGTYQTDFSGNAYSSGVYFYSLFIGGVLAGVKKMILLK